MYLIFKKINKIKVMSKFNQLCVLQGTIMPDGGAEELEKFFKEEMGVTVKFETQVKTLPDTPECTETGGRNDLFFYIADDDIGKFAVPRLQMGIRWWEDVLGNGGGNLYTEEFLEKYKKTW
tara:strand:- start:4099 stop:4461 length:363 start_codon:yes stop_codon:yes gene_type:complete